MFAMFVLTWFAQTDSVVPAVLNTWQLPHLSSSLVTGLEAARQPFSLHLGPSREELTEAVESVVREVVGQGEEVAVLTHHSGLLQVEQLLASLQGEAHPVQLSVLQGSDIRPELRRLRRLNTTTIVVDISSSLIKPFLEQALQVALLQPATTLVFTCLDFPPSAQLESVRMTEVRLVRLGLVAGLDQTEDHRAVLLRSGLHLLTSVLSSLPDLPSSQRLNCSDSDSLSSHGPDLVRQVRAAQPGVELQVVVRRGGQERQAGVFSTLTHNLTILENISLATWGQDELREENMKEENLSISAHILVEDSDIYNQ